MADNAYLSEETFYREVERIMDNSQLKHDLMNLTFRDPRKDAATAEAARKEIERLEEKIVKLEKRVSDAGWREEAHRIEAEREKWKGWR